MNICKTLYSASLSAGLASGLLMASASAQAEDALWEAITNGKVDAMVRYRYEHVDDDLALNDGEANTIRFALGYKTGAFHGFRLYGQFEHVQAITDEDYNDLENGKAGVFPVIADPESTEVKQAYVSYEGFSNTLIKAGRQIITYRDAPFHRFLGTVLWRQNWQTHDGFSIVNTSLPNTTLSYGYTGQVNNITTRNEGIDGHLFNVKYTGFKPVNIEAYTYLLDYDPNPASGGSLGKSTNTYGIRGNGAYPLNDTTSLLYTAEYAHQTDAGDNPLSFDTDYYLLEAGLKFKLDNPLQMILVKASYEVLGSDNGTKAFITPLGTNHAFQGWADRFLSTPNAGIEDAYLTFITQPFGAKFIAVYHDYSADEGSFDYGTELNLLLTRTFKKHYTVGIKYADYDTDTTLAQAGSGTAANDASKFWLFTQIKF